MAAGTGSQTADEVDTYLQPSPHGDGSRRDPASCMCARHGGAGLFLACRASWGESRCWSKSPIILVNYRRLQQTMPTVTPCLLNGDIKVKINIGNVYLRGEQFSRLRDILSN